MKTRVFKTIKPGYDETILKQYGIDERLLRLCRSFVVETDDYIYIMKVNDDYDVLTDNLTLSLSADEYLRKNDFEIMESFRYYGAVDILSTSKKDILYKCKPLSEI